MLTWQEGEVGLTAHPHQIYLDHSHIASHAA